MKRRIGGFIGADGLAHLRRDATARGEGSERREVGDPSRRYINQPRELIDLCLECKRVRCSGCCAQYLELKRKCKGVKK